MAPAKTGRWGARTPSYTRAIAATRNLHVLATTTYGRLQVPTGQKLHSSYLQWQRYFHNSLLLPDDPPLNFLMILLSKRTTFLMPHTSFSLKVRARSWAHVLQQRWLDLVFVDRYGDSKSSCSSGGDLHDESLGFDRSAPFDPCFYNTAVCGIIGDGDSYYAAVPSRFRAHLRERSVELLRGARDAVRYLPKLPRIEMPQVAEKARDRVRGWWRSHQNMH